MSQQALVHTRGSELDRMQTRRCGIRNPRRLAMHIPIASLKRLPVRLSVGITNSCNVHGNA